MNRAFTLIGMPVAMLLSLPLQALQQPPPPQPTQQQPAEKAPAQNPSAAGQPPATDKPTPPTAYSYDPQGRRDPFISLLGRGSDPRSTANRASGLAGVLIGEVTVKGILRDRSGFIAMLQAPDSKTYIVRPGERLMDGTVKAIAADVVIFSQDVNDPLSVVKQREVRKTVRPSGESGE